MTKQKIISFLFLLTLGSVGLGVVWSVVIYFDNWDKIMSDYKRFELFRFPVVLLLVGYVFNNYAKMLSSEE